jgi:hypothetical protein
MQNLPEVIYNCVDLWQKPTIDDRDDIDYETSRSRVVCGIFIFSAFVDAKLLPEEIRHYCVWSWNPKPNRPEPVPPDFFQIEAAITLVSDRFRQALIDQCGAGWEQFYQFIEPVFENAPPVQYWLLNLLHKVPGAFVKTGYAGRWLDGTPNEDSPAEDGFSLGPPFQWPNALVRSAEDEWTTYAGLNLAEKLGQLRMNGILMTAALHAT